jgi:hypothetical protein
MGVQHRPLAGVGSSVPSFLQRRSPRDANGERPPKQPLPARRCVQEK